MRYFLRRRIPPFHRVLLVESGSRTLSEIALGKLYGAFPNMRADLVTCYPGLPEHFRAGECRAFRVADYSGRKARKMLVSNLRANRYDILVLICSAEPIMTKWKWMLAARLPAKLLIVNENADYFFFDRSNLGIIRQFVAIRAGLSGANVVETLARIVAFPFAFLFLLGFAAKVHLGRRLRTL